MYEADDIKLFLPCVWNDGYWSNPPRKKEKSSIDSERYRLLEQVTGTRLARACDPKTRSATIDPKRANTVWADLIDVKRAWLETDLTLKERQALFLAYGLPPRHRFTQEEIGFNQGVSHQTISERLSDAIDKMLIFLNGESEEVSA